jgi:hypothetical protein
MNPLQIDSVTPDTQLITISIGGNDVNYRASLVACGKDGVDGSQVEGLRAWRASAFGAELLAAVS